MTDLVFDDPCILFALGRESRPFRREFRRQQRFPGAPCPAWFRGPEWLTVLVLETGMTGVEEALAWALSQPVLGNVPYRPKLVLSAGFAGGLQEGLATGDLILATEVVDLDGNTWSVPWPGELPAGEWRPPLRRGRLVTAPRIAGTAEQKRELGQRHGALAVDMESALVARQCSRHRVPFGCVRAISDDVSTSFSSRLLSLLGPGKYSMSKIVLASLMSPHLAGELWRLAQCTRKASRQLGLALGELLTLTLPLENPKS